MKAIREAARTVAVMAETEVLVVGSGPGGLAAALASARQGADTMLMERFGCFGGNITQAGVESIAWYRHPETIEAGRDMVFNFGWGRGILPERRLHPGPRLHQCLGPDPGRNGRAPAGHVGHRGAQ
jgi:phytoene dehydrogenase-like protein